MEGSNESANDIENQYNPLEASIRKDLDNLSALSPLRCIYRVPERLRHGYEKAYTPQVVSIGPLHHGKSHFKAMEEHKKRYLRDFLGRTHVSLYYYFSQIKGQEAKLRSYYAESIEFSSDEFVTMVLVDATFIIELLLRYCFPAIFRQGKDEYVFKEPRIILDIVPDLRMLENQLPFFILEELFDPSKLFASTHDHRSIINLSYQFFKRSIYIKGIDNDLEKKYFPEEAVEVKHFVDFIRTLCLPLDSKTGGKIKNIIVVPTITELHQAGVEFRVGTTIKNLIAFEQCHCKDKRISDYIVVLDNLVNSPKDVDILVKRGIVAHGLGDSSGVSSLINTLGKGVLVNLNNFYFASISKELNKYYGTRWHTMKANLRQKYLNTPWAIISVAAAVVLLLLTIIQTICSIVSIA